MDEYVLVNLRVCCGCQTMTRELVASAYFSMCLRRSLVTCHSSLERGECLCRWPCDTSYKFILVLYTFNSFKHQLSFALIILLTVCVFEIKMRFVKPFIKCCSISTSSIMNSTDWGTYSYTSINQFNHTNTIANKNPNSPWVETQVLAIRH